MKLNEILAIAGQPGLYKYVGQLARGGVIVEALTTGKRSSVPGSAQVSALSEISMFTQTEDMPLVDIYNRLLELSKGEKAISHKESNDKIKEAFETLLPEYDRERVRVSDMKKCFAWYNAMVEAGATTFEVVSYSNDAADQEEQADQEA